MMSCTGNSPYHMELIGFALSMLCRVGRVLALRRAEVRNVQPLPIHKHPGNAQPRS